MEMIFCVEDDGSIRDLMIYTLNAAGFQAMGFENGESFFEALQTQRPRLVMLDIMLPGEDGISILKKLRTQKGTADIPVIMATAKGTEYDKVIGLDLGADDYLVKPFGMMEMVSRIRAVLRRVGGDGQKAKLLHAESGNLYRACKRQADSIDIKRIQAAPYFHGKSRAGVYPRPASGNRVGNGLYRGDADCGCPYRDAENEAGRVRRLH